MVLAPETTPYQVVGKPEPKLDAIKLARKTRLYCGYRIARLVARKVLHSPHAHARITHIDASRARALPGVAAVLTWQDIPRVVYSTAGQSDPIPGPLDTFSLDHKVRSWATGSPFVAAETPEIAEQALRLIEVDYENSSSRSRPCRCHAAYCPPRIHDEPEYVNLPILNRRKTSLLQSVLTSVIWKKASPKRMKSSRPNMPFQGSASPYRAARYHHILG